MRNNVVIIGYDLNYEYAQISVSGTLMEEPETLYLMDEKDGTELPLMLGKMDENSPWMTGVEVLRLDTRSEGIVVKDLLRLALEKNHVIIGTEEYYAADLLTEFIRLSLQRFLRGDMNDLTTCLVFTVPRIDEDVITLLKGIAGELGIRKDVVFVQDYKESFYDFVIHQQRNLWNYDVMLLGYSQTGVYSYKLSKSPLPKSRKRELILVQEGPIAEVAQSAEGDRQFLSYVSSLFGKSLISSVYLIGEEFEADWFPKTLDQICKNRRVFLGRNLYSKGACYGGFRKMGMEHPDSIYLDSYKIISQISLRLKVNNKEQWYPLVFQGENWYEVNRSVEILVDNNSVLQIQVDTIGQTMPTQEVISLEGLFEKQRRTVRLSVEISFMFKNRCRLYIHDVDFGEIRKATGYELSHTLQLDV